MSEIKGEQKKDLFKPKFLKGDDLKEKDITSTETGWVNNDADITTNKKVIYGPEGGKGLFIDPNRGIGSGAVDSTTNRPPFFVDLEGNLYATSATISNTLLGSGSWIFGDGFHETVTVTAGNTTTLSTETFADIVAVEAGATIYTNNYRLWGATSITNAGAIVNNGKPGGNANGAAAPGTAGGSIAAGTYAATVAGKDGSPSGTLNGQDGNAATGWAVVGVAGGASGEGGAGGAAGALTNPPFYPRTWLSAYTHFNYATGTAINTSSGSGSGGGGGLNGSSGAGGASGSPGGICFVASPTITNSGTISSNGGHGGNGGNAVAASTKGGGGGGGGASGGAVILLYKTLTNTGTIEAAYGAGGIGGAGDPPGANGANGSDGNAGKIYYITVE